MTPAVNTRMAADHDPLEQSLADAHPQLVAILNGDLDELLDDPLTAPWSETYEEFFTSTEHAFRFGVQLVLRKPEQFARWRDLMHQPPMKEQV